MKKISKLLIAFTVLSSFALQGCTDQEATIATGAIVGAAIGAIITSPDPAPRCHDSYRTQCTTFRDYYGNIRRECREVYQGCRRHYSTEVARPTSGLKTISPSSATLAQKYGLSMTAADQIAFTVGQLKSGDSSALDSLQLSSFDSQAIAQKLNVSPEKVEALMTDVQAESSRQLADFNSSFWTSCRASGKWATPQNSRCSNAAWTGCSPETGASLCYAR